MFDLIVIGAGPGGYVCAIEAAHKGLKTAIVEKQDVGGTCLNRGCIPTKALLHSAEIYSSAKDCAKFGINIENPTFDFSKIHEYKASVVNKLKSGVEGLFKANGIELIRGVGMIKNANTVSVDGTDYETKNIVIATGSIPAMPPIPGLDLEGVINSNDILDGTPELCRSLVIIGGGVIGVEIASVYSSLGCDVTIVEAMDRILPTLDREISQNLNMILKKRGVKINTASRVSNVTKTENGELSVNFVRKEKEESAVAEKVLVAIGRRAYTGSLFGEGVEIETDRGRIVTNENFETNIKGIYAIGDVSSRIQLAHVASAQGVFVADLIAGEKSHTDLSLIPSCIYTSPEIASIGLSEDECKEKGIDIKVGKVTMFSNGKTIIASGERGFIKIISQAQSGIVLGAVMMCERATDMLSELTTAVANKLTVDDMLKVMRPHPTFNEGISEAFESVNSTAIHTAPTGKR